MSMATLRSIWAWAVFAFFCLFISPVVILTLTFVNRLAAYRLGRHALKVLLRLAGIRVRTHGLENWDRQSTHILMGNHVNFLDPFILVSAFPMPFAAIEKVENFKIPFYGWLMRRWGNIGIERENRSQAFEALQDAAKAARADYWLLVMPEGTRSRNGKLGPFKKGGFHMAMSSGYSIAPFSMVGAYEVLRTGSWLVRPGDIDVYCHPPVCPAHFGPEDLTGLMARVREFIADPLGEGEAYPGGVRSDELVAAGNTSARERKN